METLRTLDNRLIGLGPHSLGKLIEWKLNYNAICPNLIVESPLAGETN